MKSGRRVGYATAAVLGALFALLASASPAAAHASLVETTPSPGSIVPDAPSVVRLTFNEPIEVTAQTITIVGPDGKSLGDLSPAIDPTNGDAVEVTLPKSLPDGTYDVRWHVISVDGHPVQGRFEFAIGHPSTPLVGASTSAGGGPSLLGGVGRAMAAAGALCVVGLSAFSPLVLLPARRRLRTAGDSLVDETSRRLQRPLFASATAAVVGTLLVLVDTAAGSGPLLDVATNTRTGVLLLIRIAAVVLTTVVLTAGTGGRMPTDGRMYAGLAGSLVILLTFSLSSHAAAALVDRPIATVFDVAHLTAAGVWTGGLLALALAGLPAARMVGGKDLDLMGDSAAALFSRYSLIAQVAMIVVLVTGGYAALIQITTFADLGQTWWGLALTAKLALWISVLLFAAANAFTFVPALASRAAARARRLAAVDQLRSAIRVELVFATGLIVIAALMAATAQPIQVHNVAARQQALERQRTTSASGESRGYVATVKVVREGTEPAAFTVFEVTLTTQDTLASAPSAQAILTGPDGVGRSLGLKLAGAGVWRSGDVDVDPGRYRLATRFDRSDRIVNIPVRLTVPS